MRNDDPIRDAYAQLQAGMLKLREMRVDVPLELNRCCHALHYALAEREEHVGPSCAFGGGNGRL